jgi:hypothetical protein
MFTTLAPRTDPEFVASYTEYWHDHNPLLPATFRWPEGKIYTIDNLMPREAFASTPVCNECWLPSGRGLAAAGANIVVEGQFSALIYIANKPGEDNLRERQISLFKEALRHITWAAAARLLHANAAARQLLASGPGLSVKDGCLHSSDSQDAIQGLIASCGQKILTRHAPGGEMSICLGPRQSLRVTVAPLRSKGTVAELPWLGLLIPAAIVTVPALSSKVSLN